MTDPDFNAARVCECGHLMSSHGPNGCEHEVRDYGDMDCPCPRTPDLPAATNCPACEPAIPGDPHSAEVCSHGKGCVLDEALRRAPNAARVQERLHALHGDAATMSLAGWAERALPLVFDACEAIERLREQVNNGRAYRESIEGLPEGTLQVSERQPLDRSSAGGRLYDVADMTGERPLINGRPLPEGVTMSDWMSLHSSPDLYKWKNALRGCVTGGYWRLTEKVGWCGV